VRFREYLYALLQRCARRGVSVLMTMEVPDLFHIERLSESGVSNMSDNVVLLQFLQEEQKIKRTLTVLKTRAALHEPEIREFTITADGMKLGPRHFEPSVE
jgi:circadian clock protein KaiC